MPAKRSCITITELRKIVKATKKLKDHAFMSGKFESRDIEYSREQNLMANSLINDIANAIAKRCKCPQKRVSR